ncbi:MAG: hypothetical protein M1826_005990 [Phylliscum demangeonii]|nr:MAG: hypothetical protein M1826_005990 [Phylliscum demangeonii]
MSDHGSGGSGSQAPPLFLHDKVQVFSVKGNYMTLTVKPKAVDLAEWIAHQVVEQFRVLTKFVDVVQGADPGKPAMCNPISCPSMSAGSHTYTWLDNSRQPTRLAAPRYIELVEKWIASKIMDPKLFPIEAVGSPATAAATYASGGVNTPGASSPIGLPATSLHASLSALSGRDWIGKGNGFPEHFFSDCRNIYKQMLRVFAHLYWAHFEWPFYHYDLEASLNSCFMLFVLVGTELDLLTVRDLEPMQSLLDRWIALDRFPSECKYLALVAAGAAAAGAPTALPKLVVLPPASMSTSTPMASSMVPAPALVSSVSGPASASSVSASSAVLAPSAPPSSSSPPAPGMG